MSLVSPYNIAIIKEGQQQIDNDKLRGGSSVAVLTGTHTVLVNTGLPQDRDLIIAGLQQNGLSSDAVEYVVCTDGHIENTGNLNLFPKATFIVGFTVMRGDCEIQHDFLNRIPFEIDDDVEVVPTPGMFPMAVALIAANTQVGTVAFAGGAFRYEADLETPELWVERSMGPDEQQQSRIDILTTASYILPRYGPLYRVPDEYKRSEMKVVLTP